MSRPILFKPTITRAIHAVRPMDFLLANHVALLLTISRHAAPLFLLRRVPVKRHLYGIRNQHLQNPVGVKN